MLFRAFYALPDSIKGEDGRPVNALLGTANSSSARSTSTIRGPWCSASDPTRPTTAWSSSRATTPSGRVPDLLAPQFADSPFFEAFGWTVAVCDSLEADDLLGTYARLEAEAGGRSW